MSALMHIGFPLGRHPALALSEDAHAEQRIGMTDSRQRQPASTKAPHTIPKDVAVLAAPRQRAMPEPPHLEPKDPKRVLVQGHAVIRICPRTTACNRFRMTFAFTAPRRFNRRTGEST